jgi:hypothetical protein
MSQLETSCQDPLADATQRLDEAEPLTEIGVPPDSLERSSEQFEWELTRWPEGAEL